ncbi:hypothetical protein ELI43_36915 [Rhizobium leguminosarum]|uniref:hypothetical protein n=1 Tax=Rhizobium leguminosarum TaxID=384 RepID=UPI0010301506|nr:hypothetical protein [Rhizobium leguminosarum]TAU35313.1 hypothetical protein ELI43_36915 [Rhizobium leguminosarum]
MKDGLCRGVIAHLVEHAVPFIVYSGDAAGATAEDDSFRKGVRLSKPCTPHRFEKAVKHAMDYIPEV